MGIYLQINPSTNADRGNPICSHTDALSTEALLAKNDEGYTASIASQIRVFTFPGLDGQVYLIHLLTHLTSIAQIFAQSLYNPQYISEREQRAPCFFLRSAFAPYLMAAVRVVVGGGDDISLSPNSIKICPLAEVITPLKVFWGFFLAATPSGSCQGFLADRNFRPPKSPMVCPTVGSGDNLLWCYAAKDDFSNSKPSSLRSPIVEIIPLRLFNRTYQSGGLVSPVPSFLPLIKYFNDTFQAALGFCLVLYCGFLFSFLKFILFLMIVMHVFCLPCSFVWLR